MKKKELQRLYDPVRNSLWNDWDPMGVNGNPEVHYEYDRYAAKICQRLLEGADEDRLILYLRELRTLSMGVGLNDRHDKEIVRRLLSLVG
jgi:predicted Zn-dependent peptidase